MELPPYRIPTLRNTIRHMWHKGAQYLQKMGGVILIASVLIWALGYYPKNVDYSVNYENEIAKIEKENTYNKSELIDNLQSRQHTEQQAKSYIGQIGKFIEPVMRPLGFDWKMSVSILSGVAAKEIVVSTMGVLYQADENESGNTLVSRLQS